jgi:RHS repeat-associated protein
MEKDPEIKGEGNSYTTEFRQYDPRLGRWLSLDPLMSMFPDMSPYVAFDNNPVYFVDPYGLASTNGDEGEEGVDPLGTGGTSECDDGKGIGNEGSIENGGGDWNNAKSEGSNIEKAIKRTGIGGDGNLSTNDGLTYRGTFICHSTENFQKNQFYEKHSFVTDYSLKALKEQSDLNKVAGVYIESVGILGKNNFNDIVSKSSVTNTFVIRDNFIYHKQTIETENIHFHPFTGEVLLKSYTTTVVEEKQYFINANFKGGDNMLDDDKLYRKSNSNTMCSKVSALDIDTSVKNLILQAVQVNLKIKKEALSDLENEGIKSQQEEIELQINLGYD